MEPEPSQFLASLHRLGGGWCANHALQRVLNVAAIVIVAMTLGACGKSLRKVPESFAISVVQTQTTGLPSAAGTGRLLSMHPSSVTSSSPTNYWVENTELLNAADL